MAHNRKINPGLFVGESKQAGGIAIPVAVRRRSEDNRRQPFIAIFYTQRETISGRPYIAGLSPDNILTPVKQPVCIVRDILPVIIQGLVSVVPARNRRGYLLIFHGLS